MVDQVTQTTTRLAPFTMPPTHGTTHLANEHYLVVLAAGDGLDAKMGTNSSGV